MVSLGTHSVIERAELVTPRLKMRALNFYPDIRMLRSMRRELETESRLGLHGHERGNPGYRQDHDLMGYRASSRPYRRELGVGDCPAQLYSGVFVKPIAGFRTNGPGVARERTGKGVSRSHPLRQCAMPITHRRTGARPTRGAPVQGDRFTRSVSRSR